MRTIKEIFRSYAVLDVDGRHINGTDKQSNHNYSDAYERTIADFFTTGPWHIDDKDFGRGRESIKLMMEIGVADGSCLCAWREIFPNATIVGMDIHHSDRAHGERMEFHIGDQRSKVDCENAANNRLFDMIVEDATHKLADSLLTLFWMWPYVKPGGIYVIEEFEGASGERDRIKLLWPGVEIVGTCGPHIQDEPLVVFRKPM